MSNTKPIGITMRVLHRYIGFFLAGIMAVYALSGIVLIFRNTNVFKKEKQIERQLEPAMKVEALGREIGVRNLKFTSEAAGIAQFKEGTYNSNTGMVKYTTNALPFVLEKLTHLHKASTKDRLYYFNIFFAVSLFFFVLSSFWMFRPRTKIFKKGMYFAVAGVILMFILLYF